MDHIDINNIDLEPGPFFSPLIKIRRQKSMREVIKSQLLLFDVDKQQKDAPSQGAINSLRCSDPNHGQVVSLVEQEEPPVTGIANAREKRIRCQEQLTAKAIAISAGLEVPEYKCIAADNIGQEKIRLRRILNNEPYETLIEPHRIPLHEHHDSSPASELPQASQTFRTTIMPSKGADSMGYHARYSSLEVLQHKLSAFLEHMLAFIRLSLSMISHPYLATSLESGRDSVLILFKPILQLSVNGLFRDSMMVCGLGLNKWAEFPGSIHRRYQQSRPPMDRTSTKAHSVLASTTDGNQVDEHCTTGLFLAPCDIFVQAPDQRGRQNVEFDTQNPDVFALPIRSAHRSSKFSKLCRVLFACCALSNLVTLAHPSGPIYWGTFVSGTFSTLCSYVELQLPTGVEGGRNDLAFIIVSKSISGISMLLSILFAAGLRKGWLKGREKHVFVMLILFLTPGFCYLANISLIQDGHHWLEGIPLFTNICAMFVHCGITGVRAMQITPLPLLPGPRRPSPAAVRDEGNSLLRRWTDA